MNSNEPKDSNLEAAPPTKALKKASVRKRARHNATSPSKTGKQAKTSKGASKASSGAKKASKTEKAGSKTSKVLDLLKRPGGVTTQDLSKATGWQAHSVRGFLSGMIRKKMGITVNSTRTRDGVLTYSVKA